MLALRGVFGLWLAMVERLEAELVCYVCACDFFLFFFDNMLCLGALLSAETQMNAVFLSETPEIVCNYIYFLHVSL